MATITIVYSQPDPDGNPETATVLLDGEALIIITRGDDEDYDYLVKLASNARVVAETVLATMAKANP